MYVLLWSSDINIIINITTRKKKNYGLPESDKLIDCNIIQSYAYIIFQGKI